MSRITLSRYLIETAGGEVVGFGVLIDRRQPSAVIEKPLFGAYKVEAVSYAADELPEWLAEIPVTKPGTTAAMCCRTRV